MRPQISSLVAGKGSLPVNAWHSCGKSIATPQNQLTGYIRCSENVIKIQKSFRGALGRRLYDMRLKQLLKAKRMGFYDLNAALIQKM